jgi:hypothetical protein
MAGSLQPLADGQAVYPISFTNLTMDNVMSKEKGHNLIFRVM